MFNKKVVKNGFSWNIGRKLANLLWDSIGALIGIFLLLLLYFLGFLK